MLSTRTLASSAMILIAAACVTGCSTSKSNGKLGVLQFTYDSPDDTRTFNKPIATGAKLDMRVYGAGVGKPDAQIESVTSSDPAIIRARKLEGNALELTATGSGDVKLTVNSLVEGTVQSDHIWVSARPAATSKITHECLDDDATNGFYLANSDAFLPLTLHAEDGRRLIGHGYFPVTVSPPDMASLIVDSRAQNQVALRLSAAPGPVRIQSSIDDAFAAVMVVEPGDVDGVELADISDEVSPGSEGVFRAYPTIGENRVCHSGIGVTIVSTNKRVCDVVEYDTTTGDVTIAGRNEGVCRLSVTFLNGNGGAGATSIVELNVR